VTTTTKDRIIEAALETLKEDGFAGASARAIARRGDFNQALVFYHFGTVNDLLLAALDRTSEIRMAKYADAVTHIDSVADAVRVATDLYREDLASGHITVMSELIAGSLDRPDLGPELMKRMEPWIELTETAVVRAMESIGIAGLVPPRTVAYAIVSLFLGIDLISHLESDQTKAEAMFDSAHTLAGLLANLGGGERG
jgi:AcrR family transcriptional regulator